MITKEILFSCLDNTSLNATDTEASIEEFCRRSAAMTVGGRHVAAVCVYPRFVACAKRVAPNLRVATVAGAFPHGQLPLALKVAEVRYAVEAGADEVDIVINRGGVLAGEDAMVADEVAAMKEACQGKLLKVILEVSELPSPTLVGRAARLAISGGADFIKTSTGKGAAVDHHTALEAAAEMLAAIKECAPKKVGFKAAGGLHTVGQAMDYATLATRMLGEDFVEPRRFRLGASRLAAQLCSPQ